MNPPPPMLPAAGYVTDRAKPVAMAASTALPPAASTSRPAWLAMARGEVDGVSGSWASLKANRPQWLRDQQVNVLVQVAREKHADLPDVTMLLDYVKDNDHRLMWNVMIAIGMLGRPSAAPPGAPPCVVGRPRRSAGGGPAPRRWPAVL